MGRRAAQGLPMRHVAHGALVALASLLLFVGPAAPGAAWAATDDHAPPGVPEGVESGSGSGSGSGARATAPIVLVDDRGRRVTLRAPAGRIVTLLPSLTETVCELGACVRLVGTDRYSNWPAAVRGLPKLGGLEDAQVERIAALKPDLVLVANAPRLIERLEGLGLPVLMLIPQTMEDARRVAGVVGQALGDEGAGARLWQRLDARIEAAARRVPPNLRGRRVYVEVANAPYAAGEASFVGALGARLGLANIVPASLGAFPQLNPEFVLRAQPDVIVAPAAVLAEMAARPGWAQLQALRSGRTCALAPAEWDTLVRSGPRLAEAADALADCLQRLPAPETAPPRATARRSP